MTTRILIVDDEPQILRALRINLSVRGYEVVTARSGAEAAPLVADAGVILLDLGLPDVDGVSLIDRIRETLSTPIIVLSARDTERGPVGSARWWTGLTMIPAASSHSSAAAWRPSSMRARRSSRCSSRTSSPGTSA